MRKKKNKRSCPFSPALSFSPAHLSLLSPSLFSLPPPHTPVKTTHRTAARAVRCLSIRKSRRKRERERAEREQEKRTREKKTHPPSTLSFFSGLPCFPTCRQRLRADLRCWHVHHVRTRDVHLRYLGQPGEARGWGFQSSLLFLFLFFLSLVLFLFLPLCSSFSQVAPVKNKTENAPIPFLDHLRDQRRRPDQPRRVQREWDHRLRTGQRLRSESVSASSFFPRFEVDEKLQKK